MNESWVGDRKAAGLRPARPFQGRFITCTILWPARSRAEGLAFEQREIAALRQGGRLRAAAASLKPQIQDSKLNKIAVARLSLFSIRAAACGARARSGPLGSELRASAAGRLRPADRCAIELTGKTHQQGPAVTGCGGSIRSCKINNRAQPAEGAHKAAASQAAVRFSFGICAYRIRGFCTIRSTSETT